MIEESKVKRDLMVPFAKCGNQLGEPDFNSSLKANYVFKSELRYVDYRRGRSSLKFVFEDGQERRYEMFASDFDMLVRLHDLSKPVAGKWSFRKAGSNYGLVYVTGSNQ